MNTEFKKMLVKEISNENNIELIEDIKEILHQNSVLKTQPVNRIKWVPIDQVTPNDYNPNSVAKKEMGLLYTSILHDGYTQPIVTIKDEEKNMYVIVDGFHRYYTAKTNSDILDRNKGYIPIVVFQSPPKFPLLNSVVATSKLIPPLIIFNCAEPVR